MDNQKIAKKQTTEKKWTIKRIAQVLIFLMLSFFVTTGAKVHFGGIVWGKLDINYIESFQLKDIFVFIITFVLFYSAFVVVKKYYKKTQGFLVSKESYKIKPIYIWLIATAIILVAWLPYILSFAPGSVLGDSFSSIEQIYSGHFSNHHPVAYTLLVGVFVKIGHLLENINIGIFLYSIFQSIILAGTLGYIITFLAKRMVKPIPLAIATGFFAIFPVFPSYAIIMWKDPIFSVFLLLLGLLLYSFAERGFIHNIKRRDYLLLIFMVLGVAFFRNNGLFILIPLVLSLLLLFKKSALKVFSIMSITILVSLIIQGPIYSALKIHKPSVEALSIPIQQIAYVVSVDPDVFSDEEKDFLNNIMPFDIWKESYTPVLVDNIKWHESFNTSFFESHLPSFMKLWFKKLPKEFGNYVNAYLLETLGFWHPYYQNEYGYIDQYILDNDYGIHEIDLIKKTTGVSIKEKLEAFRPMVGSGFMVFVMFVSLVLSLEFQKKKVLVLYLASALCWLIIMISTPAAFSLRYIFVLPLSLPIFVFCPFFRIQNAKKTPKK